MSKRRADSSLLRPTVPLHARTFRPIELARFDPQANALDGDVGHLDDRRVWLEATSHGRVVGRVELEYGTSAFTPEQLEALGSTFRDDGPALFETIPDERLATATVVVSTICT